MAFLWHALFLWIKGVKIKFNVSILPFFCFNLLSEQIRLQKRGKIVLCQKCFVFSYEQLLRIWKSDNE